MHKVFPLSRTSYALIWHPLTSYYTTWYLFCFSFSLAVLRVGTRKYFPYVMRSIPLSRTRYTLIRHSLISYWYLVFLCAVFLAVLREGTRSTRVSRTSNYSFISCEVRGIPLSRTSTLPYLTCPYLIPVPGISLCSFFLGTQGGDPVVYPYLTIPHLIPGTWYLIFSFCSFSLGTQGGDLVVYPYLTFPYIILVPGISLCSFSRGTQDGDPINSLISYPFLSCEAFHYLVYPYLTFPYLWYFFVQFFSRHSGWGPVISV